MRPKFLFIILLLTLATACGVYSLAGQNIDKKKADFLREIRLFSDCLAIVRSDYVDEAEPKILIYGALKGMLSSLDPHSQFLDPDTYNELKSDTRGEFGGLGIEITIKDGLLTVVTPIDDTPAWRAGIKAGDRIVEIDHELTRDMTLTEAVKKMRGRPGKSVSLTILRESDNKITQLKIVRDNIKVRAVKDAKILEGGIGVIRLTEFQEDASRDMDSAITALKTRGMRALILDLRNNPGGLLDAAVRVTEKFLEKGKLIVRLKGRKIEKDTEYYSRLENALTDIPMIVLINEGSASGSEILAGCLQDHKRAVILGTRSFGKGLVQTLIPLNDGSALKLSTSRYFRPFGKQINNKGITPDIITEEAASEIQDIGSAKDRQLQEALSAVKAILIYKGK